MPDSFVVVEATSEESGAAIVNNRMMEMLFMNKYVNIRLDNNNFLLWKQQVLLMIQRHELEHLLDESLLIPPQTVVDDTGELMLVGTHTSAKIWNTVLNMYSKLSTTKIMSLHGRLRSLRKGELSVHEFSTQIKEICDLLATNGSPVSEIDQTVTLLNGLSADFEPFVAAITVSREPFTFDTVTSVLIDAESRISDLMKTSVRINLTRHNNNNGGNASGNRDRYYNNNRSNDTREKTQNLNKYKGRPRHQCQLNGKIGHLVDRCWHRFDENYKGVASRQSRDADEIQANFCKYDVNDSSYNPFVHTAAGGEVVNEEATNDTVQINSLISKGVLSAADKWYPDSGAIHHVTYDKAGVSSGRLYVGKGKVYLGDGSTLPISHVSNVSLTANTCELQLDNVLCVPKIAKNLLSVPRLTQDNNVYLEFHSDKCFVKDEETGRIQLEGKLENGLYCFDKSTQMDSMLHQVTVSAKENELKTNKSYWLWHRRLGHPASKTLSMRLHIRNDINNKEVCIASPIKSGGWQYYASFVDMYSRNVWVYLMRNKSDIVQAFNLFHALVKNQFNINIVALQTDGGGEYRGLACSLAAAGIKHRVTCSHTSQQNCVVERKHRHIIDTTLTLLAQSAVPFKYWSYAVLTAVYLINRLPVDLLGGISPFEKLYNKKPDYQFLRVFGCQCFPCLRPFNLHKFDFISKLCVFLGYSPQHHGYQCLNESGRVYISRHVVFNEYVFPCVSQRVDATKNTKQYGWAVLFPSNESTQTNLKDIVCHDPVIVPDTVHDTVASTNHTPSISTGRDDGAHTMAIEPDGVSGAAAPLEANNSELMPSGAAISDYHDSPTVSQEQSSSSRTVTNESNHVHNQFSTNNHHMVTRSKVGTFKPKIYNTLFNETPLSVQEALQHKHWRAAVEMEFKALIDNNTWNLVPLRADQKAIGSRLVAKGYSQVPGCDFVDTFSPEEVYMSQLEGFEQAGTHDEKLVCKLQKALYGLRQAPRNWYHKLQQCMCDMGFWPSRIDSSLFVSSSKTEVTYVVVYVDDILVTCSSNNRVKEVKKQLHDKFSLKDLRLFHYFLGIEAVHTTTGMFLSQKKYVEELLHKFNVQAKPVDTPLPITPKLSSRHEGAPVDAQQYRSAVGALLYECHTRPDIAFTVYKVAQFMQSPCEAHWIGVKCILRYLKGTVDYGLWLTKGQGQLQIKAFTDVDWGSDPDDRRSISGYCVYLGNHLLSWSSRKQRSVSRSTAEVEYHSLADITVECDNTSTVAMAANSVLHAKVKHVDLDVHFVREKVTDKKLVVNYVPAQCQVADVLTKSLITTRFQELHQKINVFSLQRIQLYKC
ncbi:hypothetical protein F3Y22_tig00111582pilonHSYRG00259 [Hibiscus syriacus]|uniref:Integrase catalytic domain-containing protein n=1 Tax=Hibiscus syriacus TaxID=106335 RepID=A0A6A2YDB8_HIBSY|nr:hypothetical protein F3Y22_tig00111582pilonHSYRG00259 [Hibiscus syriacus]